MAALQAGRPAWATPGAPLPCLCSHRCDGGSWVWRKEGSVSRTGPSRRLRKDVRERAPVGPRGNSVLGTGQNPEDRPRDARESDRSQFSPSRTSARPRSFGDSGGFPTQGLGRRGGFLPLCSVSRPCPPCAVIAGESARVLRVRFTPSALCRGTRRATPMCSRPLTAQGRCS